MTDRTRRIWLIAGGAAALVIVVLGFLVWWFVFRDDSPPPPDIAGQSAAIAEEQDLAEGEPTSETGTTGPEVTTPEVTTPEVTAPEALDSAGGATEGLSGMWTIDNTLGSFDDFTSSFAGYRVREELAGVGASTAVGRTPNVSGGATISGTTITEVEVIVDVATLQSDESRRDGQVRRTLEVEQFPTATFLLTTPIALSGIPAEDETLTIQADGDFTAHGVTRPVTVDIEARLVGEVIVVVGSFQIAFEDYEVTAPSSAIVLSIEDEAIVEWQLNLTRQS